MSKDEKKDIEPNFTFYWVMRLVRIRGIQYGTKRYTQNLIYFLLSDMLGQNVPKYVYWKIIRTIQHRKLYINTWHSSQYSNTPYTSAISRPKYLDFLWIIYILGILGNFGIKNFTWSLNIVHNHLNFANIFHVWFFGPKCANTHKSKIPQRAKYILLTYQVSIKCDVSDLLVRSEIYFYFCKIFLWPVSDVFWRVEKATPTTWPINFSKSTIEDDRITLKNIIPSASLLNLKNRNN